MWKDYIRNIVVIFQTTILRIVGFYLRHSASDLAHFFEEKGEKLSDIKPHLILVKI